MVPDAARCPRRCTTASSVRVRRHGKEVIGRYPPTPNSENVLQEVLSHHHVCQRKLGRGKTKTEKNTDSSQLCRGATMIRPTQPLGSFNPRAFVKEKKWYPRAGQALNSPHLVHVRLDAIKLSRQNPPSTVVRGKHAFTREHSVLQNYRGLAPPLHGRSLRYLGDRQMTHHQQKIKSGDGIRW